MHTHLVLLDSAHSETGQVILAALVEAGHLCRLTAQQLAPRLPAALYDALDDLEGEQADGQMRGFK